MIIYTEQLMTELQDLTRNHLNTASLLTALSNEELTWRKSHDSWNVLECLEHLNLYGNFYLPEIERRIETAQSQPESQFKSGWLGNYFAKMMLPGASMKTMRTFKSMNPIHKPLDRGILDKFIQHQNRLLELLRRSDRVSITRVRTSISISRWIKLRLGDTFQIVIYHNARHMRQIGIILQERKNVSKP